MPYYSRRLLASRLVCNTIRDDTLRLELYFIRFEAISNSAENESRRIHGQVLHEWWWRVVSDFREWWQGPSDTQIRNLDH